MMAKVVPDAPGRQCLLRALSRPWVVAAETVGSGSTKKEA